MVIDAHAQTVQTQIRYLTFNNNLTEQTDENPRQTRLRLMNWMKSRWKLIIK